MLCDVFQKDIQANSCAACFYAFLFQLVSIARIFHDRNHNGIQLKVLFVQNFQLHAAIGAAVTRLYLFAIQTLDLKIKLHSLAQIVDMPIIRGKCKLGAPVRRLPVNSDLTTTGNFSADHLMEIIAPVLFQNPPPSVLVLVGVIRHDIAVSDVHHRRLVQRHKLFKINHAVCLLLR